jgi:phosphopantetheinyl transferase
MAVPDHNGGSLEGAPDLLLQHPHCWLQPLPSQPALECLSRAEQRWSEELSAPLQQRYIRSRALLRQRLSMVLPIEPQAVPLHSPPGKAPRLAPGHGHISISHSRSQLLVAWSPWPIGVDLEWRARSFQASAMAARFFPASEWQRLQALASAELRYAVLQSWVRKEAAIKWQGSTLAKDLRHWCWDAELERLQHLQYQWQPASALFVHQGWLCAAVGEAVGTAIWHAATAMEPGPDS